MSEDCKECRVLRDEIDKLRADLKMCVFFNEQLEAHAKSKVGDTVTEELWDNLWHLVHPGDNSWEYTGQVVRELRAEIERLREFVAVVWTHKHSPAELHDRAAQLLDWPSLAHGAWEEWKGRE